MFKIIIYKDRNGNEPFKEFLETLDRSHSKDARIRRTKIREYVRILEQCGLPLPQNYCKHIVDDIWELRPIGDRVMFGAGIGDIFVILHCFEKKGQKTPRREIEKALREFADFKERWKEHG